MDSKITNLNNKKNEDGTFTIVKQTEEKLSQFELQQRLIKLKSGKLETINNMKILKSNLDLYNEDIAIIEKLLEEAPISIPE